MRALWDLFAPWNPRDYLDPGPSLSDMVLLVAYELPLYWILVDALLRVRWEKFRRS